MTTHGTKARTHVPTDPLTQPTTQLLIDTPIIYYSSTAAVRTTPQKMSAQLVRSSTHHTAAVERWKHHGPKKQNPKTRPTRPTPIEIATRPSTHAPTHQTTHHMLQQYSSKHSSKCLGSCRICSVSCWGFHFFHDSAPFPGRERAVPGRAPLHAPRSPSSSSAPVLSRGHRGLIDE